MLAWFYHLWEDLEEQSSHSSEKENRHHHYHELSSRRERTIHTRISFHNIQSRDTDCGLRKLFHINTVPRLHLIWILAPKSKHIMTEGLKRSSTHIHTNLLVNSISLSSTAFKSSRKFLIINGTSTRDMLASPAYIWCNHSSFFSWRRCLPKPSKPSNCPLKFYVQHLMPMQAFQVSSIPPI